MKIFEIKVQKLSFDEIKKTHDRIVQDVFFLTDIAKEEITLEERDQTDMTH